MILREEFDAYTEDYLRGMDWLYPNMEVYDYKKAGEGNMNFVVRVCTNRGNFIVKQSLEPLCLLSIHRSQHL